MSNSDRFFWNVDDVEFHPPGNPRGDLERVQLRPWCGEGDDLELEGESLAVVPDEG